MKIYKTKEIEKIVELLGSNNLEFERINYDLDTYYHSIEQQEVEMMEMENTSIPQMLNAMQNIDSRPINKDLAEYMISLSFLGRRRWENSEYFDKTNKKEDIIDFQYVM